MSNTELRKSVTAAAYAEFIHKARTDLEPLHEAWRSVRKDHRTIFLVEVSNAAREIAKSYPHE